MIETPRIDRELEALTITAAIFFGVSVYLGVKGRRIVSLVFLGVSVLLSMWLFESVATP